MTPLIYEMTHIVREIERNIELLHKDDLEKAADFIMNLTDHLLTDDAEVFVAQNFKTKDNGELLSYESVHIPFDTIEFIRNSLIN